MGKEKRTTLGLASKKGKIERLLSAEGQIKA
jgi:hypothetical protein